MNQRPGTTDLFSMRFNPIAGLLGDDDEGVPLDTTHRRRTGRLCQDVLQSNVGHVVDLSVGGMRVVCRKRPKGVVHIQFAGEPLPGVLKATPAWSKKLGLLKHEVGLTFHDLTPEMSMCLTRIAAGHRMRGAA